MRRFGTDGIRDVAGQGRLAPGEVARVGRALARFAVQLASPGARVRVAVGRDPRPSGRDLSDRLGAALLAGGVEVLDLGMVPTPVVAWTVASRGLSFGVAVSASHNPPAFNGLKPFAPGGRKLDPDEEDLLETWIDEADPSPLPVRPLPKDPALGRYVDETTRWLSHEGGLSGERLVVDLAAGAASATAVQVLSRLGAEVIPLHEAGTRPINEGCGTEHPEAWLRAVREAGGAIGMAFDGDADRVLLADREGEVLDGDDALAILAEDALRAGPDGLPARRVVGTVMTNLGLEERLRELGAALDRTAVGDRNVARRMRETGAAFGGEPSGHVVLARDGALIGDGLVAGVRILQAARRLGRPLAEARRRTPRYPQVLLNVRVGDRRALEDDPVLAEALRAAEARLDGSGRLVVRYSGTEPVLRVMAEGHDRSVVEEVAGSLAALAARQNPAPSPERGGAPTPSP